MEHEQIPVLEITIEQDAHAGIKTIKLAGALTIHNFYEFQEITRQRPSPRLLIVDLSQVEYIDSAALGSFVGLHVSCEGNDRKYALIGANDRLKSLFELTHVKSFLVIMDSTEEALKLLA